MGPEEGFCDGSWVGDKVGTGMGAGVGNRVGSCAGVKRRHAKLEVGWR